MLFLQKHFSKILLLVSLAVLFPYLYLSCFAHPIADDYHYAFLGMQKDLWNTWKGEYLNWNGRYTSNILVLLAPMAFHSLALYKTVPVIQIVFLVFSVYCFFRALTGRSFSALITLNVSILLALLYLFSMPCLAEGIYWYTGSVSYHTGICVALLYFGLVCDYFNGKYILYKFFHLMLAIILLLALSGFNEVLTLLILSFHIVLPGLLIRNKKEVPFEWWVLLVICLIGSCTMIFAPGNSVRSSWFSDHHNLIRSFSYTLLQIIRFSFDWISSLPFIFSSVLLIYLSVQHKEKFTSLKKLELLNPVLIVLSLVWVLFICIFPAYWETNILGQQRTVNTACFFFTLLWFISIPANANKFSEKLVVAGNMSHKFQFAILFLALFSMAATKNGYDAFLDIFYGKAKGYNYEMNERYEILNDAENKNKMISLKPLQNKPKSLFVLDLTEDPDHWINTDQAIYFGVEKITCLP